jgi:hypothetical protein
MREEMIQCNCGIRCSVFRSGTPVEGKAMVMASLGSKVQVYVRHSQWLLLKRLLLLVHHHILPAPIFSVHKQALEAQEDQVALLVLETPGVALLSEKTFLLRVRFVKLWTNLS